MTRQRMANPRRLECVVSERFSYLRPPEPSKRGDLAEAVRHSMANAPRSIPPRFFYDEAGSGLFEEICSLPEYYQTRTETAILKDIGPELSQYTRGRFRLVELGSGSSAKTRCVLDAMLQGGAGAEYVPIDISDSLEGGAGSLLDDYPGLSITGIVDTYERGLSTVRLMEGSRNLVAFLGSSLGNMSASESGRFLRMVRDFMEPGDLFLLGLDLDKDAAVLEAAYDDSRGVTARFNLNMLHRLNRELGADFDVSAFSHHSVYNRQAQRIEMYLRSNADCRVSVPGAGITVSIKRGELIHTENSQKYTVDSIRAMASSAGLQVLRLWRDKLGMFSVSLLSL